MLFGRRRSNVAPPEKRDDGWNPPLQVVGFIGTRAGDPDRGPMVRIRSDDADKRLVLDGQLVWVYGPRRHDLATVVIDDELPRGCVVLRDIAGVTITEIVKLVRLDTDTPRDDSRRFA